MPEYTADSATTNPEPAFASSPNISGQSQKSWLFLILSGILLITASGFVGYYLGSNSLLQKVIPPALKPTPDMGGCTLEAKICPDGSSVGRIPPTCEFQACPVSATTSIDNQVLSFTLPSGWELDTTQSTDSYVVVINRNNNFQLAITVQDKQEFVSSLYKQPESKLFEDQISEYFRYKTTSTASGYVDLCPLVGEWQEIQQNELSGYSIPMQLECAPESTPPFLWMTLLENENTVVIMEERGNATSVTSTVLESFKLK